MQVVDCWQEIAKRFDIVVIVSPRTFDENLADAAGYILVADINNHDQRVSKGNLASTMPHIHR
jgi:hypothetical protein